MIHMNESEEITARALNALMEWQGSLDELGHQIDRRDVGDGSEQEVDAAARESLRAESADRQAARDYRNMIHATKED